jgi:hypothetical protein
MTLAFTPPNPNPFEMACSIASGRAVLATRSSCRLETRRRIARALAMLRTKSIERPWRKHDKIPL